MTETVVNYVIEQRLPGKRWLTMWQAHEDEVDQEFAEATYATFAGAGRGFPTMQYRLLRRTAVITDEVLGETIPDDDGLAAQDPTPDGQCEASSWGPKTVHVPYGPGGYNRCTYDQVPLHREHLDDFGNVFLFNPGGKPRVKVLRHVTPAGALEPAREAGDPR